MSAAPVIFNGSRAEPWVALTFDDGNDATNCRRLVDTLEATATPATFFPNAGPVIMSPALWRWIARLGFPIGNHTAHHPFMPGLGFAAQLREIRSDQATIERVTSMPVLPVFRPPYGSYDGTTARAAAAAGYRYVLNWDTTFADSSRRPDGRPWPMTSYVRAATRGRNGSVILGHCGDPIDTAVLADVIASYRSRGFIFVTVPQLLGMPGARPMTFPSPPAPSPQPSPATSPQPSPAPSAPMPRGLVPI